MIFFSFVCNCFASLCFCFYVSREFNENALTRHRAFYNVSFKNDRSTVERLIAILFIFLVILSFVVYSVLEIFIDNYDNNNVFIIT